MNNLKIEHANLITKLEKLESEIKDLKADLKARCGNLDYLSDELDYKEDLHKDAFGKLLEVEKKMEDENIDFDKNIWIKHQMDYGN